MMENATKRKVYSAAYKAMIALDALRSTRAVHQIANDYGLHHVQVSQWKRRLLQDAWLLFARKRGPKIKNCDINQTSS